MTIIKPNRKFKHVKFIFLLGLLLLATGSIYVFEYNTLVNARFSLHKTKAAINETKRENADLENEVFGITDPAKLTAIASLHSLVLERNPDYVGLK